LINRPPPPQVQNLFIAEGPHIASIEDLQTVSPTHKVYVPPTEGELDGENENSGKRIPTFENAAMMLKRCAKERERMELEKADLLWNDFAKVLAMQMDKSRLTLASLFRLCDNSGVCVC
jgi:hypothetical protein